MVSNLFDMEIHRVASLFYVNDGLIASKFPYCIQWAVDFLTGIFNRWACGKIMKIQWGWSSRSATSLSGTPTQHMGDG